MAWFSLLEAVACLSGVGMGGVVMDGRMMMIPILTLGALKTPSSLQHSLRNLGFVNALFKLISLFLESTFVLREIPLYNIPP